MVHLARLMPFVQMNQLLLRVLLHLSTCDAPPIVSTVTTFLSPIGTTIVLSRVSPSAYATPSLLLPFSSYPSTFWQCTCRIVASSPE